MNNQVVKAHITPIFKAFHKGVDQLDTVSALFLFAQISQQVKCSAIITNSHNERSRHIDNCQIQPSLFAGLSNILYFVPTKSVNQRHATDEAAGVSIFQYQNSKHQVFSDRAYQKDTHLLLLWSFQGADPLLKIFYIRLSLLKSLNIDDIIAT